MSLVLRLPNIFADPLHVSGVAQKSCRGGFYAFEACQTAALEARFEQKAGATLAQRSCRGRFYAFDGWQTAALDVTKEQKWPTLANVFATATKPSRFAHFCQGAESCRIPCACHTKPHPTVTN